MKSRSLSAAILTFAALVGCQHDHQPPQQAEARVTHVVLCWLKEPGNDANRQKLIDASRTFTQIPGLVEVSAGRPLPSTRPIVDSSYDVAIVMKFTDQQALKNYATHPVHVSARDSILNPLVAKYLIYDFEE
jgi:Stress responsive A/B Barrel Domain